MPLGIDHDGRERLEFIDGDVPVPPYPGAQTYAALESVAVLLRRFRDASSSFDASGLRCRLSLVDRLDDRADADLAIGEDVRAQTTSMDQPAEHALGGEALQVGARLTQTLA